MSASAASAGQSHRFPEPARGVSTTRGVETRGISPMPSALLTPGGAAAMIESRWLNSRSDRPVGSRRPFRTRLPRTPITSGAARLIMLAADDPRSPDVFPTALVMEERREPKIEPRKLPPSAAIGEDGLAARS